MEFKELGDWCKFLEKNFSNEIMIPTLPVIVSSKNKLIFLYNLYIYGNNKHE